MARTRYRPRGDKTDPTSEIFPCRRLPAGPRFQGLGYLVPSHDSRGFVRTRGGGLAVYSTVCQSWQEYFERIRFHRLAISQDDVDRFAGLAARHIGRVRHIWLRVEHARYDCSRCSGP